MNNVMESIAKTSKTLMFKEPFYGMFLISLNKDLDTSIPTACVSKNGINCQLSVNPEFWDGLDDVTKIAVLKHELLHIAFFHLTNSEKYTDKLLFNIAADLEINQYIEQSYKGPKWEGLELSHYPELNLPIKAGSDKYYEILSKVNQNRQKQQGNPQQENDPSQGGTHGNDGSSPEKSRIWNMYDAMQGGETTVCSHEKWKEFMDGLSEADRKLIEKQVDYQVKEIAADIKKKGRGTIPCELQSYIDSLFEIKEPVLDWKAYLRRFAGSSNKTYTKKTRRKLNKRYEENPALKIKSKKHILVGIDTSGSVSNDDLKEFFHEIHHMHKTGVKISIAECDANVKKVYEYSGKTPDYISGRGGTYMSPIIEYYNEHHKDYNTLIILTDGECESEPTKARTQMLWVICSGGIDIKNIEQFPGAKVKINKQ